MKMNQLNQIENEESEINLKMLEGHYLENGRDEFLSNCINNKLIEILNFRMSYNRYYNFPERLFFFDSSTIHDTDSCIERIINFQFGTSNIPPISFFLKEIFQNNNCIVDCFAYSTFPSMFGHFTSQEYIRDGYQFIKRNIDDKDISPFLICSFFLHSTVFQDRLMSIFYINFINHVPMKEHRLDFQDFSNFDLKAIFIESFRSSLSYLSQFHFLIINEFRQKYPNLAFFSFNSIIKSILKLWKYYPFFENTCISDKPDFFISFHPTHQKCIYKNIVQNLKKSIKKEDVISILDLFNENSFFFEYAKYQKIIYKDQLNFIFSLSDIEIIKKIASSIKSKQIKKSKMKINEFIFYSMIIEKGEGYHEFNTINLVELNKMSSTEYHNHLSQISGELPKLHFCTVHSSKILKLKLFQYAEKVQNHFRYTKPYKFFQKQLSLYGMDIFYNCIKGDQIKFNDQKDFKKNILKIIKKHSQQRKNNYLICKNIIEYIFDKANSLIQDYNEKNQDLEIFSSTGSDSLKNIPIFVSAIDSISWFLLLLKLSPKEIILLPNNKNDNTEEKKLNMVDYLLLLHENKYQENDFEEISKIKKLLIGDIAFFSEIGSLIDISNQEMKEEFDRSHGMFNFGKKISIFMKIQESIEISIGKTVLQDENNQKYFYYFLYTDFYNMPEPQTDDSKRKMRIDNRYFKLNMIVSLFIIEKIIAYSQNNKYLPLKIFEARYRLKKLLNFFNMSENINPTEPMTNISFNEII